MIISEKSLQLSQSYPDESQCATLNDILFGSEQFTQLAYEVCKMILDQDRVDNNQWISIFRDATSLNCFQRDQLICDGKWVICPKGKQSN